MTRNFSGLLENFNDYGLGVGGFVTKITRPHGRLVDLINLSWGGGAKSTKITRLTGRPPILPSVL